jgi:hypothetical protein
VLEDVVITGSMIGDTTFFVHPDARDEIMHTPGIQFITPTTPEELASMGVSK